MGEMSFRQLVVKIHPDRNPNITDPSGKMTLAELNRDEPKALFNLAVEWGLVVGPKNHGVTIKTGQKPRVKVNPTPASGTGTGWDSPFQSTARPTQEQARPRPRATANARPTEAPRYERAPTLDELQMTLARMIARKEEQRRTVEAARSVLTTQEDVLRNLETGISAFELVIMRERLKAEADLKKWEADRAADHAWHTSDGWKTTQEPPKATKTTKTKKDDKWYEKVFSFKDKKVK